MTETTSPPPDAVLSRRRVLQVGGTAVALAGARTASASPTGRAAAAAPARGAALAVSRDPALHLARRLTFGPTPALLDRIRDLGADRWIDEQLRPQDIDDTTVDAYDAVPTTGDTPHLPYLRFDLGSLEAAQGRTVMRQLFSERQLYEVMVEFWANHFSVYGGHVLARSHRDADDRAVARAHALGTFRQLLHASAHSPAMLFYLDQWLSDGRNPNENYARELLELHTLGVDGGYTERDMAHAALALTGWTVDTVMGSFVYRATSHYVGPLKVLGWRSANSSAEDGEAVGASLLDYLARHPSTARHIAFKLCRRFVSDTPPASLVASTAKVYLRSDTAIVPVLKHIFASAAFRRSIGTKYRRPMELVGAAVRALGLEPDPFLAVEQGGSLVRELETLGQAPFNWPPPDGYPDEAPDWLSTAANLARWNFLQRLVDRGVGFRSPDWQELVGTPRPSTAGELVDRLTERLAFQRFAPVHRAALLRFIGMAADDSLDENPAQDQVPALAALILSSPYLGVR